MPRLFWILCSIAIGGTILYLSLTPGLGLPSGGDKIAHLAAYLAWTGVSLLAARSGRSAVIVIGIMLMTGAAVEVVQPYVGRYGSLGDMVANGVGVLIGSGLGIYVMRPVDDWIAFRIRRFTASGTG